MEKNQQYSSKVKKNLDEMNEDIKESEKTHPKEPETHIKRTVYKTEATKFRDLLRQTQ